MAAAFAASSWIPLRRRGRLAFARNGTATCMQINVEGPGAQDENTAQVPPPAHGAAHLPENEPPPQPAATSSAYAESFTANFDKLLPLLSESAAEEASITESADDAGLRALAGTLSDRMLSTHRRLPQDENLRPFQVRARAQSVCAACDGAGEVVCGYCGGVGFMDLGEDCERFQPEFDGWTLAEPRRAVGSYFHCPMCGGRCRTRCEKCFGMGTTPEGGVDDAGSGMTSEEIPHVAAGEPATEIFNLEAFLHEHRERIERTSTGMIIMRATKRGRRKRKPKSEAKDGGPGPKGVADVAAEVQGDAPSEPTTPLVESDAQPKPPLVPAGSSGAPQPRQEYGPQPADFDPSGGGGASQRMNRRSTDFIHSTDFQVGRRLSTPAGAEATEAPKKDDVAP